MAKEIEIPEGYEARIEGNKVVLEPKESEDERIRKRLIERLSHLETDCPEDVEEEIAYLEKQKEQKSTEWGDEDEEMFACVIDDVKEINKTKKYKHQKEIGEMEIDWLKNRFKSLRPQPKQEWGEEDEKMHRTLIHDLGAICEKVYPDNVSLKRGLNWLKSIRPQPKQEWSEGIKKTLDKISDYLKYTGREEDAEFIQYLRPQPEEDWTEYDEAHMNWLCRIVHSRRVHGELSLAEESELGKWMDKWLNHNPQPHWKPSEEQMDALLKLEETYVLEHEKTQETARLYMVIKSLKEQLLKIRKGEL